MKWLHISDIHVNAEFNNMMSNVLRAELPKYIEDYRIKADYLFITGDYRDSAYRAGGFSEDSDLAAEKVAKYILDIAKSLEVAETNIYLVPGNHDLDRRGERDKEIIKQIIPQYKQYKDGIREPERSELLNRFSFFRKVHDYIHPGDKSWDNQLHCFRGHDEFDLLLLNSAITCYGEEERGEMIVDTLEVEKLLQSSYVAHEHKPLIVLSHYSRSFFDNDERENLEVLFKGRPIYYLCGHSHKLQFDYDDDLNLWEVMVGATKKDEEIVPIFSLGEIATGGNLSFLEFYKYDFAHGGRWIPYQRISNLKFLDKLEFVGKNYTLDEKVDSQVIHLPMQHSIRSKKQERKETIVELSSYKYDLLKRKNTYTIALTGLPLNASILIGYALHSKNKMKLLYEWQNNLYTNSSHKAISFCEKSDVVNMNMADGDRVDLCFYIQAKPSDDGERSFYDYMELKKKLKWNPCVVFLKNTERYDVNVDLEMTASVIADKMTACHDKLKKQYKIVKVHLFFNGFGGLALLLGNQMPMIFPVQLYDYDSTDLKYSPSFLLKAAVFDVK